MANILEEADILFETAESAPGRGNIWARLKGGNQPALILLHHIDVVPVDRKYWDMAPLSGKSGATASMAVALLISRVLAFLSSHRFLR